MRLKIRSKKNLIPVLVVVQEEVNQTTILEIMEHSPLVWEKFSILPTVLIIFIKISSELKGNGGFDTSDFPFLLQCDSKFWASKCYYSSC